MTQCSATGNASYQLTLSTSWRGDTHPLKYPGQVTAFGDVSIAVHTPSSHLYKPGSPIQTENGVLVPQSTTVSDQRPLLATMRTVCPQPGVSVSVLPFRHLLLTPAHDSKRVHLASVNGHHSLAFSTLYFGWCAVFCLIFKRIIPPWLALLIQRSFMGPGTYTIRTRSSRLNISVLIFAIYITASTVSTFDRIAMESTEKQ